MLLLTRNQAVDFIDAHAARLTAGAGPNPFARPEWLRHFLLQVGRDDWTVCVAGSAENAPSFLYRETPHSRRLHSLNNYYSSLHSPLHLADGDRAAAIERVAADLRAARPRADTLTFAPLAADADTGLLESALGAAGWYVRRYFAFGNWYLPCDGLDFASYMQARDSKLYNTWTRKAKKFRSGTDGARLELVTAPADVARAMDAYDRIYAQSWKVPEPYPGFIRGWAAICAERGWLRLGLAWLGEVPIAAQFWFTIDRRAYIFKLAYDEAHQKLSGGTVLSALLFEQALDVDRVTEIDYLTGDDGYKRSWVSERRERVGLIACNLATPRGLLAAGREFAGQLRQRLRPPVRLQ